MNQEAFVVITVDGKPARLSLHDAHQLLKDLQEQIREVRASGAPILELNDGYLTWPDLDNFFAQIYDRDRVVHFWSRRLMRKLLDEWSWMRMRLKVRCVYCEKIVEPDEKCASLSKNHRYTALSLMSIDVQSIIDEHGKFRLNRGEGHAMSVNFKLLIESLKQSQQ